jgi:hypothetical protein
MTFMSLSGDPEIVIARTPATSRSLHNCLRVRGLERFNAFFTLKHAASPSLD